MRDYPIIHRPTLHNYENDRIIQVYSKSTEKWDDFYCIRPFPHIAKIYPNIEMKVNEGYILLMNRNLLFSIFV